MPGGWDLTATLTLNDSGKFEDRWTYLKPAGSHSTTLGAGRGRCVWVQGMDKTIYLPVAHAEGKFIPRDDKVLEELKNNGQILFRYVGEDGKNCSYPDNPNGSVEGIAGICDSSGRILGMMPHPERFIVKTQHPRWTRGGVAEDGDGLAIFRNGVEFVKSNLL